MEGVNTRTFDQLDNDSMCQVRAWTGLYAEEFGIKLDPSFIEFPERQSGFGRLIIVAHGVTAHKARCALKPYLGRIREANLARTLDDFYIDHDRDASKGSYAIWVRNEIESRLLYQAAFPVFKMQVQTLTEWLLQLLSLRRETGAPLNVRTGTLCAGSRSRRGLMPVVDCSPLYYCNDAMSVYASSELKRSPFGLASRTPSQIAVREVIAV